MVGYGTLPSLPAGLRSNVKPLTLGLAVLALAFVALASWTVSPSFPQPSVLFGQPFDSDVPVQWDSTASADLDGLSRYFNSPDHGLQGGAIKGRTMDLAQLPKSMMLDESDKVPNWSKKHFLTVAENGVDKQTVKGIWADKDQAWAGIDDILPTDTPYAFQMEHAGKGEEAKMQAFLKHADHQLKSLEHKIVGLQGDKKDAKQVTALTKVLDAGEKALRQIEKQVAEDQPGATHQTMDQLALRKTPAKRVRGHYENAEEAEDEMNSYFDHLAARTNKENRDNARRAGVKLSRKPHHIQNLREKEVTVKDLARKFATSMAQQLEAAPAGSSESCQLCVKIFGCMDCCEPVCTAEEPENKPEAQSQKSNLAEIFKLEKDMHTMKRELEAAVKRTALSQPCECTSRDCKECPDHANQIRARHQTSLSQPCECQSAECRECPDHTEDPVQDGPAELWNEKKDLHKAQAAVAKADAILRERVAALEATKQMAIRQGLGAYGDLSSEAVWPQREPYPGNSEQIASGFSGTVQDLSKKLFSARQKIAALKGQLKTANSAATHEARVVAKQKHAIDSVDRVLAGRARHYISKGKASETMLPFYEQPGEGGRKIMKDVIKYRQLVADGDQPPY